MGSSPFHGIFSALNLGAREEAPAPSSQPDASATVGRVAVDIYEQDDYVIVKAPIAGVRLSDLEIEVNDNVLTIRGSRRQESVPTQQFYVQECFWGPFSRSVTLPFPVDSRKIRATFTKDCILKILIPKEQKTVNIVRINEA